MAQIECHHCHARWDIASSETSRCPNCGWAHEIWFDREEAERVAEIYNSEQPPVEQKAGVRPLIGMEGFSVSFPDQGRLAAVAETLLQLKL